MRASASSPFGCSEIAPPDRGSSGRRSSTTHARPPCDSRTAAASPAKPAPTITTGAPTVPKIRRSGGPCSYASPAMKIGLIGAGNMATALARGWGEPVLVSDVDHARAEALAQELGGEAPGSNAYVADAAGAVVLC